MNAMPQQHSWLHRFALLTVLATFPLLYQPGTRWVYSVSVDIQGYLVEKLSGKTFPEFLRTRLFEPDRKSVV